MQRLTLILGLVVALLARDAVADPSVPWTPTSATRHALELLADEGGLALPVTQWPLPRAAVMRALDTLPRELPPALDVARGRVAAELRAAADPLASIGLRSRDEALSGFGDDATPGSWLGARSSILTGYGLVAQIGARVDQGTVPSHPEARLRLDDTAIALEAFGAQLAAWAHHSWWGPGWQSSLVLGNNSPPLYGVGVQRARAGRSESPWLSWMGPWSYDFFIARNDDAMHSYLVGTRLTMRPFSLLEIAVTRTAQWGGEGRPQSVSSFLRMLVGRGTNANGPQESSEDPANEMAGFDLRVRCPGGLRCAAYTQLIGEDATHNVPTSYLGLYGVESWSANGRHRWYVEFVETICGAPGEHKPERPCAYRNRFYPEGYANAGRWIGSAVGADSRVATLGWLDAERGTELRLHAGSIGSRIGVFSLPADPEHSGRMQGLAARQSWVWGPATLRGELDWLVVDTRLRRQQETRIGTALRMPF